MAQSGIPIGDPDAPGPPASWWTSRGASRTRRPTGADRRRAATRTWGSMGRAPTAAPLTTTALAKRHPWTTTTARGNARKTDGNVSPEPPVVAEHQPGEETGRTPHRTFSERLPGNRHSSARSVGARSARVRGTHQRPVSEAWIGLYRVNNRHGHIITQSEVIIKRRHTLTLGTETH